ncbi:C2 domain containing protein [Pyrenophora tritici-repentis]|nr:C2 domain-containing protein [Pyrenophora tritici-repentis]KAF7452126.1 C2 domain containing protein [Pyrenophora tritici-repentis]KAI0588077.1 C2 domain-containing protein [Pyrenophora tritici-repentis]KAI0589728.1 C2 domain-containing protein [Pyrenophora tritici-repentis]KAI0611604.1 C2 domain-containing protein [Pyrenophora tritici-repentis]
MADTNVNGLPPADAASGAAPATEEKENGHPNGDMPKPQKSDTGFASKKKGPEGGFDETPIPRAPPGYTVKFTLHRANNLPLADINTLSADPFVVAQLTTGLPTRHKEDPPLTMRTPTIRQSTDPEWNSEWIVANVPASGFRLKCRIYDEDPADHDDRLGNVHVEVGAINEGWEGIHDQTFPIRKRMVSKRAYALRAMAVCFGKAHHMSGTLNVSVEVLGRTGDENGGRAYTIGPQFWIRHYSPLLGRLLGQKEPNEDGQVSRRTGKQKPEKYNFQSNQMQLRGPVPEAMYHRYVEFKPFVKSMYTAKGVRGFILSKALHHQHARVYNFDAATEFKVLPGPCKEFAQKFLELVHWDQGGRIFTYVLTLDALFRFTETGKEFGIDMLSKHTMHSDVAPYIAFSGEFFIRRLKHKDRKPPDEGGDNAAHPPSDIDGGPPNDDPKKDPAYYELVIDNDSGTYRPNAALLPQLKAFFETNFPGLHIRTLDCQGDAEKMEAMKSEQRERKKQEGQAVVPRGKRGGAADQGNAASSSAAAV